MSFALPEQRNTMEGTCSLEADWAAFDHSRTADLVEVFAFPVQYFRTVAVAVPDLLRCSQDGRRASGVARWQVSYVAVGIVYAWILVDPLMKKHW
jgi:hypothetical protein